MSNYYNSAYTGAQIDEGVAKGRAFINLSGMVKCVNNTPTAAVPGTDYGYPVLLCAGTPTTATIGCVGQHLINTVATEAPYEYVCVSADDVFYWVAVGSGTSGGARCWVRYSAYADGTDFTNTWTSGQNYIGTAVAESAPEAKTAYVWALFKGETGATGATGKGIASIVKTGTSGKVDTYTITYTDGTTSTYTVTNGQDGEGSPGTATPQMDGTAAVGTATAYSREDHVHPTDTSRASATDVTALTTRVGTAESNITAVKTGLSNPNLLDNWYFGNPVNQRGATTYTSSNNYGIDRWRGYNITDGVISTSGVTWSSGSLYQCLESKIGESLSGKTLTATVLDSNGNLISGSGTFTYGSATIFVSSPVEIQLTAHTTPHFQINNNGTSRTIVAVKLEVGTQQTLAHQENSTWVLNEVPNYTDQLMRCYRYYWQAKDFRTAIVAWGTTTTQCAMEICAPVAMRTASPAISYGSVENLLASDGSTRTLASISILNAAIDNYYDFRITATATWTKGAGLIVFSDLILSADL